MAELGTQNQTDFLKNPPKTQLSMLLERKKVFF
jgi:hypothetical protein